MPTVKAVAVNVEAPRRRRERRGITQAAKRRGLGGGTFLRELCAHLNKSAALMLSLLQRLLLQLLLGVEAPTRQLPLTMPQGLSEVFLMLRSACA